VRCAARANVWRDDVMPSAIGGLGLPIRRNYGEYQSDQRLDYRQYNEAAGDRIEFVVQQLVVFGLSQFTLYGLAHDLLHSSRRTTHAGAATPGATPV
jgi:hypothetical protein